jgi:hypothetical protein
MKLEIINTVEYYYIARGEYLLAYGRTVQGLRRGWQARLKAKKGDKRVLHNINQA